MREECLKVDRVEEGIAVCYLPDGGMTDIPLPENLIGTVRDGATIAVQYDRNDVVSVMLCEKTDDPKSAERRARLDKLFGRE